MVVINYSELSINSHSNHVSECNWNKNISPEKNIVQGTHVTKYIDMNENGRDFSLKSKTDLSCYCRKNPNYSYLSMSHVDVTKFLTL